MTKQERIDKYKKEHPEIWAQVNHERVQLIGDKYDQLINDWVDNDIRKEEEEAEQTAKAEVKASALAKLTALGLSEAEVKAIIGE